MALNMQRRMPASQRAPSHSARRAPVVVTRAAAASTATAVRVLESGSASLRGSVRKVNEDRLDVKVRLVCVRVCVQGSGVRAVVSVAVRWCVAGPPLHAAHAHPSVTPTRARAHGTVQAAVCARARVHCAVCVLHQCVRQPCTFGTRPMHTGAHGCWRAAGPQLTTKHMLWCWLPLTQVTDPSKAAAGEIFGWAGVYDGHGAPGLWPAAAAP